MPTEPSRGAGGQRAWLPWALLLVLAGAWLYTAGHPWVGFHEEWPEHVRWAVFAASALLVPLFGGPPRGCSSRSSRVGIGAAGLAAMWLLWHADLLTLGIVESRLAPRNGFCFYRPPIVPMLAYLGVGWLPLVLRVQSEAFELLARRASAERMWLRGRWFAVGVGVVLGGVVGEAVLFFAAQPDVGDGPLLASGIPLLASAPILALLVLELCLRVGRTQAPRYEPVSSSGSLAWSAIDRLFADPVALQRGHAALRFARVVAVLLLAGALLVLWLIAYDALLAYAIDQHVWPLRCSLISALALLMMLLLAVAPRPRPDPRRRPPEPDYGLPARLQSLLCELERLRALVEQGRDGAVWELAHELETELASLSEQERELLERRHVQREPLLGVLRAARPVTESLDDAARRGLHAELLRFIACAQGRHGEDPYRQRTNRPGLDRPYDPTLDAALRIPRSWMVGGLLLCFGLVSVLIEFAREGLVIAVPAIGLLVRALALAYARRMFALAVPAGVAQECSSSYSAAFEHEAARVRSSRCWASVVATTIVAGLCLVLAARGELFMGASVLAAGLLVIRPLRDRLRERPTVAMVRRLHRESPVSHSSALVIELVAQRLVWAAAPHARGEALEQCAKLLCAATELGSLAPADRESLLARLRDAIARGPALDRRQQRARELELATAERLLAASR